VIRLMVLYPNIAGAKFDHKYFADRHVPAFKEKMAAFGLVEVNVDQGLAGAMPGSPPPFITVFQARFQSAEELQKGVQAHGADLLADIPSYTDVQAQFQVSEITS
jgi:uncharacterized protein (TIGR02118 family)